MAVYKRGGVWWYHFVFSGRHIGIDKIHTENDRYGSGKESAPGARKGFQRDRGWARQPNPHDCSRGR